MAPDLNSVPASPHLRHTSQPTDPDFNSPASHRASQIMGPPPMPVNASSTISMGDHTNTVLGPGPLRHPRPMTASDLHLVLEKEQEAVVNRLTRELTLLRQQTASVASTASSTSTGLTDSLEGSTHPTSSRQHRSSSSLSSHIPPGSAALAASVSSIAPSRDTALPTSRPSGEYTRAGRSREPSVTSPRQPVSPYGELGFQSAQYQGQQSHRSSVSHAQNIAYPPESRRSTSIPSTIGNRYEETAHHRAELEVIKKENEILRRRVRELEQNLKAYRETHTHSQDDPSNGLVTVLQTSPRYFIAILLEASYLSIMSGSNVVYVKGIAPSTTEKEVRDFFSFCGKISNLSLTPESGEANAPRSATVTFEKETAAKTALLLDNTQLGPSAVHVEAAHTIDEIAGTKAASAQEARDETQHDIEQEDKPRSRIVAEYLAHGYTISDQAIQRAIALDQKHGISNRFTSALTNFDSKYKATDRAKGLDEKYKISDQASHHWRGITSYFEKALDTPTGQKVRDFYLQTDKQVRDIHTEARRLADLKSGKTGAGAEAGAGAGAAPASVAATTDVAPSATNTSIPTTEGKPI
ncbi:hypothetical protein UA08_02608 [Talaromyces atroroseus]|uniref:RRM domain-containing protein n=1 Tax=Talaromyces atroroseus TaxID=1441469 RepID=A0A225AU84_TALAT|nr:hypothetical protein UA08_02608 [Talaromyces atroroseus]OKL61924.1 hypothetical protein UA08_02608 [Talaromyces atroroseus]